MLKLEHQKRDQFAKSFQGSTQHRNYMESLLGAMYSLLDTYNTFVNNTVQAQQHNGPLPPPPTFFSNLANTSAAVNAPQPVIKKQPATMPPVNFPSAFPAAPTLPLNPNIPKKPAPAVVSPNPNVPVPPAPATTLAQPPKAKNSKKPPQQRPIYTAPHSKLAPKPLGSEPQPSVVPAPQAPQAPVQQGNGTTMNNTSTAAPTNTTSSNNTTTAPVPMNSNSKPIQLNPLTGQVKSGSGNGGITVTPKQKKLPSPNELSLPNICKKENTPPNVNGDQHHQQHHKKHHDAPVHFNTPPRESSRHPRSDESQFLFSPAVAEDYDLGLGSTPFKPNVHLQLHSSDEPIPHSHVSFSIDSDTRIPSVSLIELPSDEFRKRQASEIFISPDQVRSSKRQRSNDSTVYVAVIFVSYLMLGYISRSMPRMFA